MMSICVRYEKDHDEALEILNLAFIKVLKKLDTYNPEYPFTPWFKKITVNEAIDAYRKKRRRLEIFENETENFENLSVVQDSNEDDHWIEAEYLEHLMDSLKESERTVFNLYAIDGYSHKEIAQILSISERSSIRHLAAARKKLQTHLANNEFGMRKA
jgi:RNA polymerase sigma-70 factor (ECF subfamily)